MQRAPSLFVSLVGKGRNWRKRAAGNAEGRKKKSEIESRRVVKSSLRRGNSSSSSRVLSPYSASILVRDLRRPIEETKGEDEGSRTRRRLSVVQVSPDCKPSFQRLPLARQLSTDLPSVPLPLCRFGKEDSPRESKKNGVDSTSFDMGILTRRNDFHPFSPERGFDPDTFSPLQLRLLV